ncbi:MAG: DUF3892 domain-containing protein [Mycoplasmataceae bacterium]|nr:DUF3892 domain-containing protein [Mycoplasmataceae bacterium]
MVKETKKTVSTPSSKSIVKKNHISTLDTKLEVFKKDVAKTVKSLKKEAKPIKIIGRTEDSEYYILDDGRQITRQEVVDEIDKKVNSFYVGGIENILISVHPKEDIVDYVRTKPNDKEHDNLTNLKAN